MGRALLDPNRRSGVGVMPMNLDSHKNGEALTRRIRVLKMQFSEAIGEERNRIRKQLIDLGVKENELRVL
jgi:hypothetical protein